VSIAETTFVGLLMYGVGIVVVGGLIAYRRGVWDLRRHGPLMVLVLATTLAVGLLVLLTAQSTLEIIAGTALLGGGMLLVVRGGSPPRGSALGLFLGLMAMAAGVVTLLRPVVARLAGF
jgi:hypothetical protein